MAEFDLHSDGEPTSIKVSFRAGGDKTFHEKLKGAMTQRKWLLQSAPPMPSPLPSPMVGQSGENNVFTEASIARPTSTPVGIAGLERRGLESRKNNEVVIGTAFEDLEALMASAKEIVALAEKFAIESGRGALAEENSVLSESAAALGMVTTKDMLGSRSGSDNLYLSELSRTLAEYLTDDRKGILRAEGGIMSLVDLWAVFNRSRNGVELASPLDFHKAAELWEKLGLPVRLRRFKSGLLVVQHSDWNDDKTIRQLKVWLNQLQSIPPAEQVPWDWPRFGCGVNAQQTAQRFGWSVGVATEELEMAEDKGVLCREEGIEGIRFWSNYLIAEMN
jgi:ESCRT-II complex subunit VPS36